MDSEILAGDSSMSALKGLSHARIQELEAKVEQLAQDYAALKAQLAELIARKPVKIEATGWAEPLKVDEYIPQFTQWPKGVGG
jgi:hypothetical protein